MKGIALVTCQNNKLDEKLASVFVREGFNVFVMGDKPMEGVTLLPSKPNEAAAALREITSKLDILLDTTDVCDPEDTFTVCDGLNGAVIERVYRQNVLRPMAVLKELIFLMDNSECKRLFYLTGSMASINETRCVDHFGYTLSKAALHQFLQMTRNTLAPKGYTFRVFDPMAGEVSSEAAAESAYNYIIRRRGTENHDPLRDDEDNLVFRDALGRQHAW